MYVDMLQNTCPWVQMGAHGHGMGGYAKVIGCLYIGYGISNLVKTRVVMGAKPHDYAWMGHGHVKHQYGMGFNYG